MQRHLGEVSMRSQEIFELSGDIWTLSRLILGSSEVGGLPFLISMSLQLSRLEIEVQIIEY